MGASFCSSNSTLAFSKALFLNLSEVRELQQSVPHMSHEMLESGAVSNAESEVKSAVESDAQIFPGPSNPLFLSRHPGCDQLQSESLYTQAVLQAVTSNTISPVKAPHLLDSAKHNG